MTLDTTGGDSFASGEHDPTADPRPDAETPATMLGDDDRLAFRKKLYQRSIWPAVQEVARGGELAAPLVVDLDPTTFCDLACPECISAPLLNRVAFSPKRLAQLVREIADSGVRAVILIGGGEPLAHPGTSRAIEVLAASGLRIGLVTNGTLLGRHLEVVARQVAWVRVSVDAARATTYASLRPAKAGRSPFRVVLRNIANLARCTNGSLGYSFMLVSRHGPAGREVSNASEIVWAARLAKWLGCDYFELKASLDASHHIAQLSEGTLKMVRAEVERLHSIPDSRFRVLISSSMRALLAGDGRLQPKAYQRCQVAELRTLVTPTGVYVCPYHRGEARFRLGDLQSAAFPVIWRGSSRARVSPKRDCPFHCARHESNIELGRIGAGGAALTVVDDYDPFL